MDIHQNARLTFACRVLLVQRVQSGRPKVQVGRELGVSVRTVQKWLRRYEERGPEGLKDRSSRPHHSPQATDEVLRTAVVALRRQRMTLLSIAVQLGLSRATVARIAKAAGLNRLSKLQAVPLYQRYERAEPGELLHLDVKKLGRIIKIGHRITGDRGTSNQGPAKGWEYLHVAVDDASRVAYALVLPEEDANNTVAFLRAAVGYYAGLQVRIKGLYTDNALAYRGRAFAAACAQLRLSHHYTRPYTPRTNGKAERFIQTALREWAYARAYHHSYQRRDALPTWLHGYNWHRPHMSLAGQPPISRIGLNRNNLLRLHS